MSEQIEGLRQRLQGVEQSVSNLRTTLPEYPGIGNVHNEVNDIQRELSSIEQDYWTYLLAMMRDVS